MEIRVNDARTPQPAAPLAAAAVSRPRRMVLTYEQARRLWNLPADLCQRALDELLVSRFLKLTRHGAYVRCDAGL